MSTCSSHEHISRDSDEWGQYVSIDYIDEFQFECDGASDPSYTFIRSDDVFNNMTECEDEFELKYPTNPHHSKHQPTGCTTCTSTTANVANNSDITTSPLVSSVAMIRYGVSGTDGCDVNTNTGLSPYYVHKYPIISCVLGLINIADSIACMLHKTFREYALNKKYRY